MLGISVDADGSFRIDPKAYAYRLMWLNPDTGKFESPYVGGNTGHDPVVHGMDEKVVFPRASGKRLLGARRAPPLMGLAEAHAAANGDGEDADLVRSMLGSRPYVFMNPLARSGKNGFFFNTLGTPHYGYSVIGVPRDRYSIVNPEYDFIFFNQHKTGERDGLRFDKLYEDAKALLTEVDPKTGKESFKLHDKHPLAKAIVDDFKQGNYYKNVLADADREMLEGVDNYWDLYYAMHRMASKKGGLNKKEEIRDTFYIPGGHLFDGKDDDPGWEDFMVDKLVDSVIETMLRQVDVSRGNFSSRKDRNPDNYRLLQVAVPVGDILKNNAVGGGKDRGRRDFAGEYIVDAYVPMKNLGSISDYLRDDGPFRDYYMLRRGGARGREAWKDALGDEFGDLDYIISDDEMKTVKDGIMHDIEPLLRQCSIVSGLTRGPGND